ncbi:MAG: tetratricopeptide repeat protein [Deltaproteobacteria bacterium]|nr:tetratricopeptide repeat protein [Deltaproteobacteria bacterium]
MTVNRCVKAVRQLSRTGLALLIWATVLAVNVAISRPTAAQSEPDQESQYKALVQEALFEFNDARYEEALALFERAHAINPNAQTLRGIGMAAFEARQYGRAIKALRAAFTNKKRPLTEKQRAQAENTLEKAKQFVASYRIEIKPPEAQLTVDGQAVTLPDDGILLLDFGKHEIVAALKDYQTVTRQVVALGGREASLEIVLPVSQRERESRVEATETPKRESLEDTSGDAAVYRTLGWIGVASAVVALGGAVVAWQIGEDAIDTWNNDEICERDGKTREQNCADEYNTIQAARTWGITALSAGAAFGITSAIMFILAAGADGDDESNDRTVNEACFRLVAVPDSYGLGWSMTF